MNESEVIRLALYRIREIRENKGMSQTELSRLAGVARATIWKLESGGDEVTTSKTLTKIAKALDVSVAALFFDPEV